MQYLTVKRHLIRTYGFSNQEAAYWTRTLLTEYRERIKTRPVSKAEKPNHANTCRDISGSARPAI